MFKKFKPNFQHYVKKIEALVKKIVFLYKKTFISPDHLDQYSGIGGKMKIQLEKPALNNFKAYGWQK